jgi:hypothetical protein
VDASTFYTENHPQNIKLKLQSIYQAQWLTPLILAIQEVEMGRTALKASLGKKFKTPLQPIKAEHGGTCRSSQLHKKHKKENGGPG